ncbi:TNF receptor-associated factor 4-like [Dysidea avara]|uniref:TNF receptor-associated factor 4-like n=1 Tax=Dysidea avara TaxID=196820 RepID=UPI00332AE64C
MMSIIRYSETCGYHYKFVDTPPDRLLCTICHFPSRDPYLTTCCGYVFCKSCLDDFQRVNALRMVCPACRQVEFVAYVNKQVDREVKGLHVMCTNKESGCEWQGELNDINNHLGNSDGCQFQYIKCPNECGKMLHRWHLDIHVKTECPHRMIDCQHCHIIGEREFIEGEHKEQCPKFPLPCPNKCELESVPREEMEAHKKDCPLEMVQCQYHNVGCEERMMRKRKRNHEEENMEEHLLMTKLKLSQTMHKLAANEIKLCCTENRVNNLEVMLHHFINSTESSNKLTSSAQWSFHLNAVAVRDTEVIHICPVIMKIPILSENKKRVVWCSDPFYSHSSGYKLCLYVYFTGIGPGKGTRLSVSLRLMKGSHDDELTWPLRGKFEVKLLNQISDCEHCSETMNYDEVDDDDATNRATDRVMASSGCGFYQFISNEDLHKVTPTCQYLKYDSVFFQISKM